jgi:hypothetical protein
LLDARPAPGSRSHDRAAGGGSIHRPEVGFGRVLGRQVESGRGGGVLDRGAGRVEDHDLVLGPSAVALTGDHFADLAPTPQRLPQQIELAAYFVAAEALANIAKYSRASQATLRAWSDGVHTTIEIADDGIGGADDSRGTGLRGLVDRVEALDASLRVHSPAGAGTTITVELPCS